MNELLQRVGQHMVDVAPPSFQRARLEIDVQEGNVEILSRFEQADGSDHDLPIDILELGPVWLEIRQHLATETGREPFRQATFALSSDGDFDLDLRYDEQGES